MPPVNRYLSIPSFMGFDSIDGPPGSSQDQGLPKAGMSPGQSRFHVFVESPVVHNVMVFCEESNAYQSIASIIPRVFRNCWIICKK